MRQQMTYVFDREICSPVQWNRDHCKTLAVYALQEPSVCVGRPLTTLRVRYVLVDDSASIKTCHASRRLRLVRMLCMAWRQGRTRIPVTIGRRVYDVARLAVAMLSSATPRSDDLLDCGIIHRGSHQPDRGDWSEPPEKKCLDDKTST
jgi:hypothetical protein